jgi:adenylate kinase family enzyme
MRARDARHAAPLSQTRISPRPVEEPHRLTYRRAVPPPTRYLIHGVTGSGKTTLAALISARTGIPWHSMDELTWEPGWVAVPEDVQRQRGAAICAQDAWVMDTAYSSWLDLALSRADVIVALDYPRWLSLARLVRRTVLRVVDQKPICNGNTETWRQTFSGDSIIVWHFRSFTRKRDRIRSWLDDPPGPQVVHLTSPRATSRWLETLEPAS